MATPKPIGPRVEFELDERQREICDLLELIGPEPVAFFTDACRIMSGAAGVVAQTHLAGHLLREIEGRLHDVIQPIIVDEDEEAEDAKTEVSEEEPQEDQASHREKIEAAAERLGLDEPTTKAWLRYALRLYRFAHRASLAGPRDLAEFRQHFDDGQSVLVAVLRHLRAFYVDARPRAIELASVDRPTKKSLSKLKNEIPHSAVVLGEFFGLATLAWFPLLRKAGYFSKAAPLVVEPDGSVRYVEWPPARFLVRAAGDPALQSDIVEVLESLQTNNPDARDSTVEAALRMPPDVAARLAPKIARYIRESSAWWVPRHSEELVTHFIEGGEIDAALTVTEPLLANQPRTADWRMRHAFTDLVPKLFPHVGNEGFALLRSLLTEELNEDDRGASDLSTIWRESIAGGHDMRRRDLLITAINRAGSSLITGGAASVRDVVAALAVDERQIFTRIALHLVAEHPDPEVAAEWLGNERSFYNRNLEREYAELARASFAALDTDLKNRIFGWIDAGPAWRPKSVTEEEIPEWDDLWQLRRLRALPELPDEWQTRYDELVARYGEPEDPITASRMRVFSGTRSPVEKAAILELTDDELLEFVDTWEPEADWGGPSYEGLASALRDAAIDDPVRFSRLLPALVGRLPIYARHVVFGLQHVVTNNGTIEWPPVLQFALDALPLARTAEPERDDRRDDDPSWAWAANEPCRLIVYGLSKRAIPIELKNEVWEIIAPLTEDRELTVDDEDATEARGTSVEVQSWGTVRSQAIEAVIQYASWLRANDVGGDARLPDNVREILDLHLDPESEETRTVAAVYGRHFNQLYGLDRDWARAHVADVFPDRDERQGHRDAAWRGFIRSNHFWPGSWGVLEPQYRRELDQLTAEQVDESESTLMDEPAALLYHLVDAYLYGCVDLVDESLLGHFFSTAPLAVRRRFIDIVGTEVSSADAITDETRDKLQRLWEWRAEKVLAGGDPTELAPFSWWFGSGNFDDRWSLEQLIRILEAGAGVASDYTVTHRLPELVDDHLALVVHALAVLIDRAYTPHVVLGAQDEIRAILRAGLGSGDATVAAEARATVSRLYAERHVEFGDFLNGDPETEGRRG